MKTDDEIRAGLMELAATTRLSPDAWFRIDQRAQASPRHRRWRSIRPVVALVAAVSVLVLAIGLSQRRSGTDVAGPTAPVRGTAYAFGTNTGLDDVVRIDLATGRTDRINADPQNYAGAVVLDGVVYVAGGCDGGKGELLRLEGAHFTPIGGDAVNSTAPACSVGPGADGTLLWVSRADPFEGPWVVHQWDPHTSTDRVVHQSDTPVAAAATGPSGELAMVEGREATFVSDLTLAVKRPDGTVVRHPLRTELAETIEGTTDPVVSWGANGLVAIAAPFGDGRDGDDSPSTLVVDATNGKIVRKVTGWAGAAWSPDGRSLLVSQGRAPSRLAVLEAPSFKLRSLPQRTLGWRIGRPVAWLGSETTDLPPVVEVAAGTAAGVSWSVSTHHDKTGHGCYEFRSGSGGRSRRCAAPEPSRDEITALAFYELGSPPPGAYVLTALLPVHVTSMTATFLDGSAVEAKVIPITVEDQPVGLAVLAATQPIIRMAAGATVLTCSPDPLGTRAGGGCVAR